MAEGGHVLQIKHVKKVTPVREEQVKFNRIGLNQASIFPGFCAFHDSEIFKFAENRKGPLTTDDFLRLAYRTICLEIFKKKRNIFVFNHTDFRSAALRQGLLKDTNAFLEGTIASLGDLERIKSAYEFRLHNSKLDEFRYAAAYFEISLPFTYASPFSVEYDLMGTPLSPGLENPWEAGIAFAGTIGDRHLFAVCGLETVNNGQIKRLVDSFHFIPLARASSAAFHLAIDYSENTYFRPSWINALIPEIKNSIIQRFRSTIPGIPRGFQAPLHSRFDLVKIPATDKSFFP